VRFDWPAVNVKVLIDPRFGNETELRDHQLLPALAERCLLPPVDGGEREVIKALFAVVVVRDQYALAIGGCSVRCVRGCFV
jgi:hypothetical protein